MHCGTRRCPVNAKEGRTKCEVSNERRCKKQLKLNVLAIFKREVKMINQLKLSIEFARVFFFLTHFTQII